MSRGVSLTGLPVAIAMNVMIPPRHCPPRRLAGPALLWLPVALLLLLALLLAPHGTAPRAAQATDDLLASPIETAVAVGRESGYWRQSRSAERLRLPVILAADFDSHDETTAGPQGPSLSIAIAAIATPDAPQALPLSRFDRPVQARAPPIS